MQASLPLQDMVQHRAFLHIAKPKSQNRVGPGWLVERSPTRTVAQEDLQAQAALCKGPSSNVDEAGMLAAGVYHSFQLDCRGMHVPQVALK